MSNSQNRARVRARATSKPATTDDVLDRIPGPILQFALASRPETALVGWSTAAAAGTADRGGPHTDHLAALVRRARRREAIRRMLRLWTPRRGSDLRPQPRPTRSIGPSQSGVRTAVQSGLSTALPHPGGASEAMRRMPRPERRTRNAAFDGPERRSARAAHPAGRRLPEQRAMRAGTREL